MLKDGIRYRIENGLVKWMRDRNGNKLTFSYDQNSRVTLITDSLNRKITISYDVQDIQPYGLCDKIEFYGFGGAPRTIKVSKTNLGNALRFDFPATQTYAQLFPQFNGSCGTCTHNPLVTSRVWLPNGQSYTFSYNPYGELALAKLPTGGSYQYDYAAGISNGPVSGAWLAGLAASSSQADSLYRRVVEKRTYDENNTLIGKSTFSQPESGNPCGGALCIQTSGWVAVDHLNTGGSLITRSKHYFYGFAADIEDVSGDTYPTWKSGREYKTESIDANGVTVLRRMTQTWQQRTTVSWWSSWCPGCSSELQPANDTRVLESQTELTDTNPIIVSKQTFGYDDTVPFNNQNNVKEYAFGNGVPGPLVRETRTTYLTSTNYTGTSVHP